MGGRKYQNIEICGRIYAHADEAGAALGVTGTTVRQHIRAGTLHRMARGLSGPEPMPVRIRGIDYDSPAQAAKALGIGIDQVYRRLADGCPDSIGLRNDRGQHCAKPFKIGPLEFRSLSEASRVLGLGKDYVGRAYRRGSKRMQERVLAAAILHAAECSSAGAA
ncbi:hypothetical protein GN241_11120 [Rhodobacteraceae bacterium IMCC1335]